jgi:hypothetical protein
MKLIKYKDPRDHYSGYEWFWTHNTFMVGPIFEDEDAAIRWYKENFEHIFGAYSTVGSADRQD